MKVSVRKDLAIVGHNPEMADLDNRNGNVYGEVCYLVVESEDGSRMAHDHAFVQDPDSAIKLCAKVEAHLEAGGTLNEACWYETEPRYGSVAYQNNGTEAHYCQLEMNEERR